MDSLSIDRSRDSVADISLGGIGEGFAQLAGVGMWLLPLQQVFVPDETGGYQEWNDAWMAAGDRTSTLLCQPSASPPVRLLSADMLETMGLFVRNGIGIHNKR